MTVVILLTWFGITEEQYGAAAGAHPRSRRSAR